MHLISLNLESGKHIDRNLPWLEGERPDVACFQEFIEPQLAPYEHALGMGGVFVPLSYKPARETGCGEIGGDPGALVPMGVAIFSRYPVTSHQTRFLVDDTETIPRHERNNMRSARWLVLRVEIETPEGTYAVATTHLPKAATGDETTDLQRQTLARLLQVLGEWDELVLCGDFNAPRGFEIFDTLAARYRDNIPASSTTTIDNAIHHAGHKSLQYVVDGLFTTPGYAASNVSLASGLSDHVAVVAEICRVASRGDANGHASARDAQVAA